MNMGKPIFCFTSDMDWASEAALNIQQAIYDEFAVTPTYFVTHRSGLIEKLRAENRIELGIHPNFLPNSSHGNSFEEVIDTVLKLVPDAKAFRAHRCFDVAIVTDMLFGRGILYDSNLITKLQPGLAPILHESGMVRFPCFYEDGIHFKWKLSWDFAAYRGLFDSPGLKIISAHPMITAMNVTTADCWAALKRKFPPARWIKMTEEELEQNRCAGPGPAEFLKNIIRHALDRDYPILTLDELYNRLGRPLQERFFA